MYGLLSKSTLMRTTATLQEPDAGSIHLGDIDLLAERERVYLRMHLVPSGEQRITLTVPGEPARAGIDPRNLLIDVEARGNLAEVTSGVAP
jgi:hypothetical protein